MPASGPVQHAILADQTVDEVSLPAFGRPTMAIRIGAIGGVLFVLLEADFTWPASRA